MTRAQYRRWRLYAESLIEQAISILDTLDGDADREDGWDAEPSLGWTKDGLTGADYSILNVDCEHDCSDLEPYTSERAWEVQLALCVGLWTHRRAA
jgi:hypothetical protein